MSLDRVTPHMRAVRPLAVLLAACCWLSVARAQWLETVLPLPDSLGSIGGPRAFVWDSSDNKVFVGGDIGVLVIDGATNRRVARVLIDGSVWASCYNPQNDKVYCALDGQVTVIDAATDSVITKVTTGSWTVALCYNPQDNKVYCANHDHANVTVIDGATDQILATVAAGSYPEALCYNPRDDKVYCANNNNANVTVMDGAADTVMLFLTFFRISTMSTSLPGGSMCMSGLSEIISFF